MIGWFPSHYAGNNISFGSERINDITGMQITYTSPGHNLGITSNGFIDGDVVATDGSDTFGVQEGEAVVMDAAVGEGAL